MNTPLPHGEPPLKHSGLGIASFALVVFFGLLLMGMFGYAGFLEATTPGGVDEESPQAIFAGIVMIFSVFMVFVAMVLGFIGLFIGRRKRLFAGLGLGLGGALVLLTVGLLVVGSLAP